MWHLTFLAFCASISTQIKVIIISRWKSNRKARKISDISAYTNDTYMYLCRSTYVNIRSRGHTESVYIYEWIPNIFLIGTLRLFHVKRYIFVKSKKSLWSTKFPTLRKKQHFLTIENTDYPSLKRIFIKRTVPHTKRNSNNNKRIQKSTTVQKKTKKTKTKKKKKQKTKKARKKTPEERSMRIDELSNS